MDHALALGQINSQLDAILASTPDLFEGATRDVERQYARLLDRADEIEGCRQTKPGCYCGLCEGMHCIDQRGHVWGEDEYCSRCGADGRA